MVVRLPRVLLFDLAHKQCNGIIKGWLYSLSLLSESKGRFLLINILFCSAWCHVANAIFFNKKTKDWTSRTLANPHSPTSDNISLLTYPPPSLKVDVLCVSPLLIFEKVTTRSDGSENRKITLPIFKEGMSYKPWTNKIDMWKLVTSVKKEE